MATRTYWIVTDSNPATLLEETTSQQSALEATKGIKTPVFIQQYVNGRPGLSWTPSELKAYLSKRTPSKNDKEAFLKSLGKTKN